MDVKGSSTALLVQPMQTEQYKIMRPNKSAFSLEPVHFSAVPKTIPGRTATKGARKIK